MSGLPRCRCTHGPSTHTGGYGRCWFLSCACSMYRDDPTGRELPQTADIFDYLRQKGEL